MKKILALILVLNMLTLSLVGCGKPNDTTSDDNTLTLYIAHNQQIALLDAMKKKFPDINFDIHYYAGGNSSHWMSEYITHGESGDLVFYSVFTPLEEHTSQFYDLGGTTLTSAINDDIVSMLDINGSIYQIPGPLDTRCISYNKTMFDEYGWKIPSNFAELVEVVKQIRKDAPDITPIASAGQPAYYFSIAAGIAQAGFLSTADGYTWEQAFFKGEASAREGFAEGLEGAKQLIDAKAFDFEKCAGIWNCENLMVNREAAMNIQWSGINNLFTFSEQAGGTDEFGLLPFFGMSEGDKVIIFNSTGYWSINKKLGEKGNEKKLENALKVLEWIASTEGQNLMRGNNTQLAVTNEDIEMDPRTVELLELSENGYKAPMLYTGYEPVLVLAGEVIAQAALTGDTSSMIEDFVNVTDTKNKEYISNKNDSDYDSVLMENLNQEQICQLTANILLETGMGDFALTTPTGMVNGVVNMYGAAGSLYAGGIIQQDITTILSTTATHLATLELTGAEVCALLEKGKNRYADEYLSWRGNTPFAENADELEQVYFPYYWAGLDVTMNDGKVTSVKLNGVELSDTETYTVVFSQNDYPRNYRDAANVSDQLLENVLKSWFSKTPEVSAPEVLRK